MAFSQSLDFGNSTFMNLENQVKHATNKTAGKAEHETSDDHKEPLDIIDDSPTQMQKTTMSRTRSRLMGATTSTSNKRKFQKSKSDSILNVSTEIKKTPQQQDNYSVFFRNNFTLELQDKTILNAPAKTEQPSPISISMLEADFAKDFTNEALHNCNEANISTFSGDFSDISAKDVPIFSEDFNEIFCSASKPQLEENAANIWQDPSAFEGLDMEVSAANENKPASHKLPNTNECSFVISAGSNEQPKFVNKELELSEVLVDIGKIDKSICSLEAKKSDASSQENELPPFAPKVLDSLPKTLHKNFEKLKNISAWNLPLSVLREYEKKGIYKMFDWQVECLSNPKVR